MSDLVYDLSEMVDHNGIPLSNGQYIAFFRPLPTWKGIGYGFDCVFNSVLMRETPLSMGKQFKKNNINELETDPNAYSGSFRDEGGVMLNSLLTNAYRSHQKNIKQMAQPAPYYCSWLSLYPKQGTKTTTTFRHAGKVTGPDDALVEKSEIENYSLNTKAELEVTIFGNGVPDYFAFDTNKHFKITPPSFEKATLAQKKTLAQELKNKEAGAAVVDKLLKWKTKVTIECLTDFEEDQVLTLYAYFKKEGKVEKVEAGKLMVWGNKRRRKPKVVMIQVKTPSMSDTNKLEGVVPTDLSGCNNYLRQALIEVELDGIIKLDLSQDKNFLTGGLYREGNKIKYKFPPPERSTLGALWDLVTNTPPPKPPTSLGEYLVQKLDKKYSNHYKLFFFAEDNAHGAEAFSDSGVGKTTVYFKADGSKPVRDTTIAHEILHAFGLAHPFTNSEVTPNALYTYKSLVTDNIMDYGHNPKYSLWQWQWKIANENAK